MLFSNLTYTKSKDEKVKSITDLEKKNCYMFYFERNGRELFLGVDFSVEKEFISLTPEDYKTVVVKHCKSILGGRIKGSSVTSGLFTHFEQNGELVKFLNKQGVSTWSIGEIPSNPEGRSTSPFAEKSYKQVLETGTAIEALTVSLLHAKRINALLVKLDEAQKAEVKKTLGI